MSATKPKTWAAAAHAFGAGKIHLIDDRDETKAFCGRLLASIAGAPSTSTPTCRVCLERVVTRPQREIESELRQRAWDATRKDESEKWFAWYNDYLNTSKWKSKRAAVLKRAHGICEGCLTAEANQVHHTTYEHVGDEPLWELVAICDGCHEQVTEGDRERRASRLTRW